MLGGWETDPTPGSSLTVRCCCCLLTPSPLKLLAAAAAVRVLPRAAESSALAAGVADAVTVGEGGKSRDGGRPSVRPPHITETVGEERNLMD
ncbi:hypothetical protein chiPu_0015559 [Chiloscyllium punctatum]|uniref:Uncharacterized protein n=1 Tax=Chiloscyllium punctatum TaxID=137246 RepID=A0A401T322_CHIPU|nr:hypothetical protein [Chiloscyllium punctatum]